MRVYVDPCRQIDAVEPAAGEYYIQLTLQSLAEYTYETDEYTIRSLLEKGERDRRWVMKKYGLHDASLNTPIDFIQGMQPKTPEKHETADMDEFQEFVDGDSTDDTARKT